MTEEAEPLRLVIPARSSLQKALDAWPMPKREPFEDLPVLALGWTYWDSPARFTPKMWALLLSTIGEGHYRLLIMTKTKDSHLGFDWTRGQMFISPEGMARLKQYEEA